MVVSPLVSLMNDQVLSLKNKNIISAALHSFVSPYHQQVALENAYRGACRFLFVSPEKLQSESFRNKIKDLPVGMLAVDEAHCISQWGHDFRPAYRQLIKVREIFPSAVCIALTATATRKVQEDILTSLGFREGYFVYRQSFRRKNIFIEIEHTQAAEQIMLQRIRSEKGSVIVYFRNRKKTELYAEFLKRHQIPASYYHAGVSREYRDKFQQAWTENKTRVMCATTAFGMGIDKPDVRLIIHPDIPESPEAWYQEIGRAGRDGLPSAAILLFEKKQIRQLYSRIQNEFPGIPVLKKVMNNVYNYFQIAVGSGAGVIRSFQLEAFAKAYKFDVATAYYSLQLLEKSGYIVLHDVTRHQSFIQFLMDGESLYDFQLRFPQHEPLIKCLLRNYSGILKFRTPVSEQKIAALLKKSTYDIKKQLDILHQNKILEYEPASSEPALEILVDREPPEHMPFNTALYEALKQNALQKAEAMDKILTSQECRMKTLLQYFDEIMEEDCGHCDVCLKNNIASSLPEQTVTVIGNRHLTLEEVCELFPFPLRKKVIVSLKKLYEEGKVRYEKGKFYIP
jgi:ATP-dependent DNA helicase RecQ